MTKKELALEVRRLRSENRKLMQIIDRMVEKVMPQPAPLWPYTTPYDPLRDTQKYGDTVPYVPPPIITCGPAPQ